MVVDHEWAWAGVWGMAQRGMGHGAWASAWAWAWDRGRGCLGVWRVGMRVRHGYGRGCGYGKGVRVELVAAVSVCLPVRSAWPRSPLAGPVRRLPRLPGLAWAQGQEAADGAVGAPNLLLGHPVRGRGVGEGCRAEENHDFRLGSARREGRRPAPGPGGHPGLR
jgi:hypothetical protein